MKTSTLFRAYKMAICKKDRAIKDMRDWSLVDENSIIYYSKIAKKNFRLSEKLNCRILARLEARND